MDHDEFIILKFIKSTSWFQNIILPSSHLVPDMFGYLAILLLNFITSSWKGCHLTQRYLKNSKTPCLQYLHLYNWLASMLACRKHSLTNHYVKINYRTLCCKPGNHMTSALIENGLVSEREV